MESPEFEPAKVRPFLEARFKELSPSVEAKTGKLPLLQCLAYGAPEMAKVPVQLLISVHLLSFYQACGVGLGALAFSTACARCLDVLTDPVMASVSDATRSRHGRRRPYIFLGCFFYAGCLFALCSPPRSGAASTWFGTFYVLFFLADTLTNVPHNALGQELTLDTEQRRRLFLIAKLFEGVGMLLAAVLPALFTMLLRSPCDLPPGCESSSSSVQCDIASSLQVCVATNPFCEWTEPVTMPASAAFCQNLCLVKRAECSDAYADSNRAAMQIVGLVFGLWSIFSYLLCIAVIREKISSGPINGPAAAAADRAPALSWTQHVHQAQRDVALLAPATSLGSTELQSAEPTVGPSKVEEVLPNFISMLQNRPFRAMVLPWILDQTLAAMLASMLPFFVTYVIAPEILCLRQPVLSETAFLCSDLNVMSMGLVGLLVAAILSMPAWFALAARIGDYRAWIAYNVFNAGTNLLLAFPGTYWPDRTALVFTTVSFAALNGVPMGAKFLTDNVLGVCIDYDELRTGARNEAAFTMFSSFIPKVVSVPASAFPLSVLAMIGFKAPKPGGEPNLYQAPSVIWAIRVMFAIVPTFLALLSCFLKWYCFPLKDLRAADAEIKAGLLLRREGRPYRDPVTREFVLASSGQPDTPSTQRIAALLSHFPGPEPLQVCLAEPLEHRGKGLAVRAAWQLAAAVTASVAAIGAAAACMAAGLLQEKSWSWLPSLLVVTAGLAVLASAVSVLRLWAARALLRLSPGLSDEVLAAALAQRQYVAGGQLPAAAVKEADSATAAFARVLAELAADAAAVARRALLGRSAPVVPEVLRSSTTTAP
ncbi:unnamed protein product [Polarella glacialis]|uniref:Uncharacterized protein n=1 Tax=Polarella glacialis TaxID=89957 RepID=A0A813G1N9_POLGL|nr:unnamed protein product [Polarella glacialis]CAE8649343.1 unnamed protein product [Polarella glacialis]